MSEAQMTIRPATLADAEILRDIYAPYVEETAVSFEYTVPTVAEFTERMKDIMKRYPYLVAEEAGEAVGYAYASPFHEREAYSWSAELTVYLRKDQRGRGRGRLLYEKLEQILRAQNITNLYACIAWPEQEDEYLTGASARFHERMGFRLAGMFHRCGYKFGRWYSMVWMEKEIGTRREKQPPVKSFSEVKEQIW
ncbi:GNAT family N-acetyltransferase [Candidatus Bariatricus faecipullorum]